MKYPSLLLAAALWLPLTAPAQPAVQAATAAMKAAPPIDLRVTYHTRAIGRDEATLTSASPTTLATRITAPVLLVHGELDERAPVAQAKAMQAALERAGHAPEWMAVPGEGEK